MNFHIVTLFPSMFDSYLGESILARAIKEKKISVKFYNPRLSVTGKYRKVWPDGNVSLQVDDRPYAGGPGMIMRAEPVIKCVEKILKKIDPSAAGTSPSQGRKTHKVLVINFVPSAEKFTTESAKKFSKKYTDIILICGRYEGIDARVDKILKTKQLSIGDYVLTGGEIPAMVLIDSISRQVEGVLGNFNSREEERVSSSEVYTRPEILIHNKKKYKVPKVLLSGDHKLIDEWKKRA
jgi:tRNA (guanine37-N1)-methyltransferase